MLIAITRHTGDADDNLICEKYNHRARIVSPVRPEKNQKSIDEFVRDVNDCKLDAVFFHSAFSAEKLGPLVNPRLATKVRMIANGPQTAKVLYNIGLSAEMLPFFYSHDLIPYLGKWIRGKRIGIPRAGITYQKLAEEIRDAGGIPCEYICYNIVPTKEELDLTGCKAVLFTSPAAFTMAKLPPLDTEMTLMAIGDVTADAMMYGGMRPSVVGDGSIEGTIQALNASLLQEFY